jgi:hypothetical protein
MKKILFLFAVAAGIISCADDLSEQKAQFESLKQKALEAHDVIMPEMGTLMELKSGLESKKDSLNATTIDAKTEELNQAHRDMMVWMRDYSEKFPYDFKIPDNAADLTKQLEVLQGEYEEIEELKDRTLRVINEAKEML